MDLRDIVSVGLTSAERVSLTFDPSPEADALDRWVVSIGDAVSVSGETPELALVRALRELSQFRRRYPPGEAAS